MGKPFVQPTAKEQLAQLIDCQYPHYRKSKIKRFIKFIDIMIEHEPLTVRELARLGVGHGRTVIKTFNELGLLEKIGERPIRTRHETVYAIQWKFANKNAICGIREMLWSKLKEMESNG